MEVSLNTSIPVKIMINLQTSRHVGNIRVQENIASFWAICEFFLHINTVNSE